MIEEKGNPKRLYKYIKGKRITGGRIGSTLSSCVETEQMGEMLNEYFSSILILKKRRRPRGDLVVVYIIVRGISKVDDTLCS